MGNGPSVKILRPPGREKLLGNAPLADTRAAFGIGWGNEKEVIPWNTPPKLPPTPRNRIDNFKGAYGNNATATLLLDFARKHMPDTLAEIESGYNEVYEKRHKRIEERKAALLAKERQTKPEETAEAENTQPTAEVQPEEHTQTEEVAA